MFSYKLDDESELRLIEPNHAEELNALVNDNFEHIKEWSGWLKDRDRPVELTREWIGYNLRRFTSGDGFEIGIWHKGRMAGQIGYNYLDRSNRKTEIGYWLGAPFQGKGLIVRSCKVLIDNALSNLDMNRIEIRCGTGNLKSRRIPEKLGFREEGTARQAEWLHDHFIDLVIYAMLAEEWQPDIQK
jgi:ribosomal-protein-serine acetyltransferase